MEIIQVNLPCRCRLAEREPNQSVSGVQMLTCRAVFSMSEAR